MPEETIALDAETWLIRPGQARPRLVCLSFGNAEERPRLYHRKDLDGWVGEWLAIVEGGRVVVNQNIAYDFGVMAVEWSRLLDKGRISRAVHKQLTGSIWDLYDANRIRCTMCLGILIAIAKGEPVTPDKRKIRKLPAFHLDALSLAYCGEGVAGKAGEDIWRLRYSELDETPIKDWPEAAVSYASEDPIYADRLYRAMRASLGGNRLPSEDRNNRASWALSLAESWGVRTDPVYVAALTALITDNIAEAEAAVRSTAGWLKPNGSKDMAKLTARITEAYAEAGRKPPKTASGKVSTSRDTLLEAAELGTAPDLEAWAKVGSDKTDANTFLPVLQRGTGLPLHARYFVSVESGRISCRDPNLTNVPKRSISLPDKPSNKQLAAFVAQLKAEGKPLKIGVRHCYQARPGFVLSACDYNTAELRAFAQIALSWFGYSRMAEVLIAEAAAKAAGLPAPDLHTVFAAQILNVSEAEALAMKAANHPDFDPSRAVAKATNFGRLGGMGDRRFAATAAKDGVDLTIGGKLGTDPVDVAGRLGRMWKSTFPEVKPYHDRISRFIRESGGDVFRAVSYADGLIRGNVGFCDGCNHYFQNFVAQWTLDASYLIQREAYTDESSGLYGSRLVIVPHDETILEVPEHKAPEAAARQAAIMVAVAQAACPQVPISAEVALMRRWYKSAKPVYDSQGRLTVWEPKIKTM